MSQSPPPLPEKVLARVLKVSTFEGRTVLVLSGGFGLLSAMSADWLGACVGALVAGAGAVELHGGSLLRQGRARGMNWLVRAELLLLNTVLLYVAVKLVTFRPPPTFDALFSPDMRAALAEKGLSLAQVKDQLYSASGYNEKDLLVLYVKFFRGVYALVAVLTLLFQGGMALYFHRRRKIVSVALGEPPGGPAEA